MRPSCFTVRFYVKLSRFKMIRGHNQAMSEERWVADLEQVKLSSNGRNSANWGGARPGAGRPRTETLDAVECWFLADLLEKQADGEDYSTTIGKLRRMADRIAAGR